MTETTNDQPLSTRLVLLLRHTKTVDVPDSGKPWQWVVDALSEAYHPSMSMSDALHHAVMALHEVHQEPRFETHGGPQVSLELLLAPVKGSFSVDMLGPKSLETSYSVEAFYGSIFKAIRSSLRLTRCDWCKEQIFSKVAA